jgi:transcriptional regulator
MGERYEGLVEQVIAFRAHIVRSTARFKLGQDEDPQSFAEIVDAMDNTALANAMRDQRKPD